jgi:hypothetical protein
MSVAVVREMALAVVTFALLLTGSAIAQQYHRTDLTANASSVSSSTSTINVDPNLVNAWGLARASGTPWWVSDNGSGLSTLYNAAGVPQSLAGCGKMDDVT